ncbi:MAG: cyclic nucleotide-binding domain-containing protein [Myxococcota bacterium]
MADRQASRVERLIALRSFPAFADFPSEELAAMARNAVIRNFRAGERLMEEGQPPREVFFVLRGEVQLEKAGLLLRTFGPRSVVGGVAALSEDPDGYACTAMADTVALVVTAEEQLEIFEEHFDVSRRVLMGIARQILGHRLAMGSSAGFENAEFEAEGNPPSPTNLVERIAHLRRALPFAGSRLEALADLAKEAVEMRLEAGEALWAEGDPAYAFVFVLWGIVEGETADGKRMRFGPNDVAGSLGSLGQQPRWYSAKAVTPVVGLRLASESLLDVFEDHSDLALAMIRAMAGGLLSIMVQHAQLRADAGAEAAQ